jgi:flagellar basal-body rod protein FlgB
MEPVNLFKLASRQAEWLSVRQATVAANIANVNTPGFHAKDVEAFAPLVRSHGVTVAKTNEAHLAGTLGSSTFSVREDDRTKVDLHSGNRVVLEQELMKAGETGRAMEINTAIVKAFHRMVLAAVRG